MRIIRKTEVQEKCGGVSGMTLDRWERADQFPKRVQLGANSVGWYADEIDFWLEERRTSKAKVA
jgi:prophage regulatory protein